MRPFAFPRSSRITRSCDFRAVYADGVRVSSGALVVRGLPNGLEQFRLGLSIPRRLGRAATRNLMKRRLREAFRHLQPELNEGRVGYDVVVSPRPHEPMPTAAYTELLRGAVEGIQRKTLKR